MTDLTGEDEAERRERPLSNLQVLGFVWAQWMRQPRLFAATATLVLAAAACDLSIPWAAGALVEAVSRPHAQTAAAWRGWAGLSGLYLAFYAVRSFNFRLMNGFASRNMEAIVTAAFRRVQSFSADWHADMFAGATVRRVSRAMWGYDRVSDALMLMLIPTLLVLGGLAVSMALRSVLAGVFCGTIVAVFIVYNLTTAARYIRPANLASNALDSKLGATLADAVGGNAVVKSFGAEAREEARFAELARAWRIAERRTWDRFNIVGVGQNAILLTLQAGLTGLLLWATSPGIARRRATWPSPSPRSC